VRERGDEGEKKLDALYFVGKLQKVNDDFFQSQEACLNRQFNRQRFS